LSSRDLIAGSRNSASIQTMLDPAVEPRDDNISPTDGNISPAGDNISPGG